MDHLTQALRERLLANGVCEADHVPVVRFFNPLGAAAALACAGGAGRSRSPP